MIAKPDPENFRGGPAADGGLEVPQCRACHALVIWAKMPSGKQNPLDVAEVIPEPGRGVVAFNPSTGGGMPVTKDNFEKIDFWRRAGATFHVSHFSTCPQRHRFKR